MLTFTNGSEVNVESMEEWIAKKEAKLAATAEKKNKCFEIPSRDEVRERLSKYVSNKTFDKNINGKKYVDPLWFPTEHLNATAIVCNGAFEIERFVEDDNFIIKLTDSKSGNSFEIFFDNFEDRQNSTELIRLPNKSKVVRTDFDEQAESATVQVKSKKKLTGEPEPALQY